MDAHSPYQILQGDLLTFISIVVRKSVGEIPQSTAVAVEVDSICARIAMSLSDLMLLCAVLAL